MSLSIVGTPTKTRSSGSGRQTWKVRGFFQFSTTDLTGELPIVSDCQHLLGVPKIQVLGASARSRVNSQISPATISATSSPALAIIAPCAGLITRVAFIVGTTIATAAANIWTIGVINKGAAGAGTAVVADIAAAANSNNSTGGTAFTAQVPRDLTLTSTTADKTVARHDVLEWTFTKASSAANIVNPVLLVEISNSAGAGIDEECYVDESSLVNTTSGLLIPAFNTGLTPQNFSVTVARTSGNPTSAPIYGFEYEGF